MENKKFTTINISPYGQAALIGILGICILGIELGLYFGAAIAFGIICIEVEKRVSGYLEKKNRAYFENIREPILIRSMEISDDNVEARALQKLDALMLYKNKHQAKVISVIFGSPFYDVRFWDNYSQRFVEGSYRRKDQEENDVDVIRETFEDFKKWCGEFASQEHAKMLREHGEADIDWLKSNMLGQQY